MQFLITGENFNKILDVLNDYDDMDVLSITVDDTGFQIKNITNIGSENGPKWIGETKRSNTTVRRRKSKETGVEKKESRPTNSNENAAIVPSERIIMEPKEIQV